MIGVARSSNPRVRQLLETHPRVEHVESSNTEGIQFEQGSWARQVVIGNPGIECSGLIELMDNNPMVCADQVSVPDAGATLALIAVGPLSLASILVEPPTLIFNQSVDEETVDSFLVTAGWTAGSTIHIEETNLASVRALTAMAVIATPGDWADIDELFDERYGKSFFVRPEEDSEWDPSLIAGKPWAAYRLRFTPGEDTSLLTIQVLADQNGKCGGAQLIHAMNVMAGFEESLGIA